jgi:hypothetical protein
MAVLKLTPTPFCPARPVRLPGNRGDSASEIQDGSQSLSDIFQLLVIQVPQYPDDPLFVHDANLFTKQNGIGLEPA